jgi:tetratricopeptide (TPR) repeat protein
MNDPAPPAAAPTRTNIGAAGLEPGRLLAGRYRIEALLGVGGMGMVYRARDLELDLDVAVKVLRPEIAASSGLRERFRRELVLARQVTHRNVVRIHDLGFEGDQAFLTMDYVAGRPLSELLETEGRLPPERVIAIGRELAEALGVSHDAGVVHRDLKPSNILIDAQGRAYVTDFGVARSVAGAGLTATGAVVGTLDYLSPEQATGEPVDGRSDLYALGVVLFEMLTGELPFESGTAAEVTARRRHGRPRDLRTLAPATPRWLAAVVARCLEPRPRHRYPDARALLADLETASGPPRRRRGTLAALAAVAALGLLAAVAAPWLRGRSAGVPAVAASPAPLAVAVLPFADRTGRSDLAWSGRGLAELVATALAEDPGLRVVDPLRLGRLLADLDIAPAEIGASELARVAELVDADRVVLGTVLASGGRVRVDLRVAAADAPAAPGERLEAEAGDAELFAAVERLAGELRERLGRSGTTEPAEALGSSPEALAAYSEGFARLQTGSSLAAAAELQRAVAADPRFAAAWLRLAEAQDEAGSILEARQAAARAVETVTVPRSRVAVRARALQAMLAGEPQRAVALLRELVERLPNDVDARIALAEALGRAGDLEGAAAALRAVVALDPQHPRAWFLLGKWLIRAGERGAARCSTPWAWRRRSSASSTAPPATTARRPSCGSGRTIGAATRPR